MTNREEETLELLSVLIEGKVSTRCQKRVAAQIHAEITEERLKRGETW